MARLKTLADHYGKKMAEEETKANAKTNAKATVDETITIVQYPLLSEFFR